MLFHTDVVADVAVTNCMSHFSFFFLTKATIKIDNGNTVHSQDIRKFLYSFPNCSIICTGGPVYYFPGHPSNTISSVSLKFYVGFQKVVSDPLEYCDFVGPQGCSLISPIRLKTINSLFKYKLQKSILKETWILLSQLSIPCQKIISIRSFISALNVYLFSGLKNGSKRTHRGLPKNIPDL